MKIKFVKEVSDLPTDESELGQLDITLGKVYDCSKISRWGSAYIINDYGIPSLLYAGEYEIVES